MVRISGGGGVSTPNSGKMPQAQGVGPACQAKKHVVGVQGFKGLGLSLGLKVEEFREFWRVIGFIGLKGLRGF